MQTYPQFFESLTTHAPRAWQAELAAAPSCHDRVLRIPTGYGKTAGVTLAWLYHRVGPRMRRVLVAQVEELTLARGSK